MAIGPEAKRLVGNGEISDTEVMLLFPVSQDEYLQISKSLRIRFTSNCPEYQAVRLTGAVILLSRPSLMLLH